MMISCFIVQKFRSITETSELPIYNLSVLIGPNNEGKSNILQALVICLNYLINPGRPYRRRKIYSRSKKRRTQERTEYQWERDFPLNLQSKFPKGKSIFILDFKLSNREKYQLKRKIKYSLIKDLRVKIILGKNSELFGFFDTASPKKEIVSNTIDYVKIIEFITNNIIIQYIPAIRTSEDIQTVIDEMISTEMDQLESEEEYKLLKKKLNNKLNPRLRRLSKNLTMSVKNFLPDIKKIELASPEIMSRFLHDSCDIIVDDGTKTSIELKGDGIKNLIAISIIHHTTQITSLNKNIILAIEEPESHLHPEAIHKLRKVLEEISEKNQVIVTTHSPLLINRANIKKNLLVNQSRATAAKNIAEIREILGVKISDNLACASLIILVEGEEDIKIIKTWLSYLSTTIKNAFKEGKIEFDSLKGSSNLDYKISLWKNLLCDVFVFLDGDKAGENAFIKAQNKRKITEKEICFVKIRGFKESEIEDLIEINCYKEKIREVYGVSLEGNIFRNNRKKWSDRVKDTFIEKGKPWFEGKEAEIKKLVSQEVEKCGLNSLKKSSLPCIQTSIDYIEDFLNRN